MDRKRIHKFMEQVESETLEQFRDVESLFDARDFRLNKVGDWFKLSFTPELGYMPFWRYEPMARYSFSRKAWDCKIGTARFVSSVCPFFEFVCELRGYTLPAPLKRQSTVLDAGPWNGISGMYFCSAADQGRVIFMEPDRESADFITRDVQKNGFTNCEVIIKALYSHSGVVSFKHRDGGASSVCTDGALEVESASIKDLVQEYAPQGIDFFKMDIEGAEVSVADDLARYICERPASWAAIASYHEAGTVHTSVILEKCFARYPELVCKTAYPYHETIFVAHRDNWEVAENIRKLTPLDVGWKAVQRMRRLRSGK